jgi:hypothetical protein
MADLHDMPFDSGSSAPLLDIEPGDCVGGYELLRELGQGGMAEVWLARRARASAGKFVAIKLILPQYVGIERYSRMFAAEAEVAAPLSHSNICQVFDEGEDRGRSYIVMEWVDGADLAQLLPAMAELRRRDPQLRLRIAAYVIGQVLHGLSYAHKVQSHRGQSLGIVHRDISPQNVLVSVSGDVKVTDFGIAHRMIEETSGINVKGKLRYMPPEQLAGQSHAPTVDLYAVGAIFHELLDGTKFRSDSEAQAQLYHSVMTGRVPRAPSDVPVELEAVRRALLDPDPARRPQTADAAVLMLKKWPGYSEMRVEVGMLCGLAIGVVRPRTGPIVAPGQPTVPPRGAGRSAVREPDAPVARWGVARDATAVLAEAEHHASLRAKSEPTIGISDARATERRDLEPTHSSLDVRSTAFVEAVSELDLAPQRAALRPWMVLAGAAVLAVLGAIATAWVLARDSSPTIAIPEAQTYEAPAIAEAELEAPIEPDLSPSPRTEDPPPTAIDPQPTRAAAPAIAAAPSKPAVTPSRAPRSKRAREPIANGPKVTVHFRLEGGLTDAIIKLGRREFEVRPRYDGRVPAGKYDAKVRIGSETKWRSAGAIEIGASGEWKLVLGPRGAAVKKL